MKVFSGADLSPIHSFYAYDPAFSGGVFVAAADVNEDGFADIVTGADAGGGPHVVVRSGVDLSVIHSFYAFDPSFPGGVRVAAADVDIDGKADIVTGAGPSGGPHVKAFSGTDLSPLASFMAYEVSFAGGVYVAAGDENRDGHADIVTGAGSGGGPHVRSFSGLAPSTILTEFMAYHPTFAGGVRVAAGDVNGDGFAELLTAPGPSGGPHVRVFDTTGFPKLQEKGIDELRLVSADRSAIVIDVDTTNRGCEEFVLAEWERMGSRVAVRSYYRDLEGGCAGILFTETHTLRIEGLGPGRFTIFAPILGYGATGPVEILVDVP